MQGRKERAPDKELEDLLRRLGEPVDLGEGTEEEKNERMKAREEAAEKARREKFDAFIDAQREKAFKQRDEFLQRLYRQEEKEKTSSVQEYKVSVPPPSRPDPNTLPLAIEPRTLVTAAYDFPMDYKHHSGKPKKYVDYHYYYQDQDQASHEIIAMCYSPASSMEPTIEIFFGEYPDLQDSIIESLYDNLLDRCIRSSGSTAECNALFIARLKELQPKFSVLVKLGARYHHLAISNKNKFMYLAHYALDNSARSRGLGAVTHPNFNKQQNGHLDRMHFYFELYREVAEVLVPLGADINWPTYLECDDKAHPHPDTFLHFYLEYGLPDPITVIEFIDSLKPYAKYNYVQRNRNGFSLLDIAIRKLNEDAAVALVNRSYEFQFHDPNGMRPLSLAVALGMEKLVLALSKKSLPIEQADKRGVGLGHYFNLPEETLEAVLKGWLEPKRSASAPYDYLLYDQSGTPLVFMDNTIVSLPKGRGLQDHFVRLSDDERLVRLVAYLKENWMSIPNGKQLLKFVLIQVINFAKNKDSVLQACLKNREALSKQFTENYKGYFDYNKNNFFAEYKELPQLPLTDIGQLTLEDKTQDASGDCTWLQACYDNRQVLRGGLTGNKGLASKNYMDLSKKPHQFPHDLDARSPYLNRVLFSKITERLIALNLSGNDLHDMPKTLEFLEKINKGAPLIQYLDLGSCNLGMGFNERVKKVSAFCSNQIIFFMQLALFKSLISLNLGNNNLGYHYEDLVYCIKLLQRLEHLDVSSNGISIDKQKNLLSSLPPNLVSVNISNNQGLEDMAMGMEEGTADNTVQMARHLKWTISLVPKRMSEADILSVQASFPTSLTLINDKIVPQGPHAKAQAKALGLQSLHRLSFLSAPKQALGITTLHQLDEFPVVPHQKSQDGDKEDKSQCSIS